jgi:hypothetical protein
LLPDDMARPALGGGWIGRLVGMIWTMTIQSNTCRNAAGQAQFRGWRGSRLAQLLNVGCDMHALDPRKLRDALRLKPVEEYSRSPRIRAAGVR